VDVTPEQFRQLELDLLTEAAFQRRVLEAAHANGWLATHFRAARTRHGWVTPLEGDKGFFDTVLARKGRLLLKELKTEAGRVRPEQLAWLEAVGETGTYEAGIWRPRDWGSITEALK